MHAKPYSTPVHPVSTLEFSRAIAQPTWGMRQLLIAGWGAFGVLALLLDAVYRLGSRALEAYRMDPPLWAVISALLWTAVIVYGEGYRALQRKFAPRVVARALLLARSPQPHLVVCAPLYCMSFLYASTRGKVVAWITLVGIVACVAILQRVPMPYRGLIDAGVALALSWGSVALVLSFLKTLRTGALPTIDAELPEERTPP